MEEVRLENIDFGVSDEAFILRRDRLLSTGNYSDPSFNLARSFAAADLIVIAAPFWDLSFPAALKQYFEQINAIGITCLYLKPDPVSVITGAEDSTGYLRFC